jgi:hypothetical protein
MFLFLIITYEKLKRIPVFDGLEETLPHSCHKRKSAENSHFKPHFYKIAEVSSAAF